MAAAASSAGATSQPEQVEDRLEEPGGDQEPLAPPGDEVPPDEAPREAPAGGKSRNDPRAQDDVAHVSSLSLRTRTAISEPPTTNASMNAPCPSADHTSTPPAARSRQSDAP